MWIERVIAHAFGPFQDATLEFGEGMTVVAGPNEAGKTTWHAATRLALTGLRRGPGMTKEAHELIRRHRPWDAPERWEVEARLHLADGRAIDIIQDLAGKVACRAQDVVLGGDVSSEIINEGTPDASRWLGLDRDAFASVAAVSQAQIMAVADNAASLQDDLQRAAATRGTDATAAEAINQLKSFRRESVGADTKAAVGPFRKALRDQGAAEAALSEAQRLHGEYLERRARLELAEAAHLAASRTQAGVEAARARREFEDMARRTARAEQLAARYPAAPAGLDTQQALAGEVAAALDGWRRRAAPPALEGPGSAELAAQIAALPAVQDGDRRPDPEVLAASRALDVAEEALRLHHDRRATPAEIPAATSQGPGTPGWILPLLAGVASAGAGVVLIGLQLTIPGIVLAAIGVTLAAWGWSRRGPARQAIADSGAARRFDEEQAMAWQTKKATLDATLRDAEERLRQALVARGAAVEGALRAALTAYEINCADRATQAQAAAGAEGLRQALASRSALEASAAQAQQTMAAAEAALRTAAASVGERPDGTVDEIEARLAAWQARWAEAVRAVEVAIREWQELEGLMDGRTMEEWREETARRSAAAERLAEALGGQPPLLEGGRDPELAESSARAATATARAAVDALTGELRLTAAALPDVAEAEERTAAARAECARVTELAEVLDQTLDLLQAAERRVHRDIAPVLKASVERYLPAITGGAYDEVGVNPRDLSVDVKEARTGQWRDARLLSEGTREQVYLLLRVAMAEHLVTTAETAPLLLDEVTAQADPDRKRQVLDVLRAVSADRQVVLFSHDADVLAWADSHLTGPRDRVIRLGGW
ncbi:MAG: AAA family ATPase [Candidatus Limnocylindria bacterium]